MKTALRLALSDLASDPLRALFSVLGMAAVIASALILSGTADGLSIYIEAPSLSTNLLVLDTTYGHPIDSSIPRSLAADLAAWSPQRVRQVSPILYRTLRVEGQMVKIYAADPTLWQSVHRIGLVQGSLPANSSQVIVGVPLARTFDWAVGQRVTIFGEAFAICGLYEATGMGSSALWMSMEAAEALFGVMDGAQFVVLSVAPGVDPEAVRLELERSDLLGGKYSVIMEDGYARHNAQVVQDVYGVLKLLSLLALFAIPLSTYCITLLALAERRQSLGILRAVGFLPVDSRRFLTLRALLLALAAYLAAWAATLLFSAYYQARGPVFILGYQFNLSLSIWQAVLLLAGTLGFALAGAYLTGNRLHSAPVSSLLRG